MIRKEFRNQLRISLNHYEEIVSTMSLFYERYKEK